MQRTPERSGGEETKRVEGGERQTDRHAHEHTHTQRRVSELGLALATRSLAGTVSVKQFGEKPDHTESRDE